MGLLISLLLVLASCSVVVIAGYYLGIFLQGKLSPAVAGKLSGIINIAIFTALMLNRLMGDQYRGYRLFEYLYPALIFNGFFILFFSGFSKSNLKSIIFALLTVIPIIALFEFATYYRFERFSTIKSIAIQSIFIVVMCAIQYFFQKEPSHSTD